MNKVNKNDIALYIGHIPPEFCDLIIREFHKGFTFGETLQGNVSHESGDYTSDKFLVAKDIHLYDHERWDKINCDLHKKFILPCLSDYLSSYSGVLQDTTEVNPKSCIVSLYERNKGHFCLHKDSIGGISERSLTIVCYLNNVIAGGETYFVNQDYGIGPGVGNIAIFPSNFVYSHIGKKPISGDKYISVSFASVDIGDEHKRLALIK